METASGVGVDRARSGTNQEGPAVMWIKPNFVELRFGFEVTMYSEYR
jgi:coenzyme PQQ precursor peptide PqqA